MSENKSPFEGLEKDPCEEKPKPPEKDKICPTCIPDPSYVPETWWQTTEPYLNKKECLYEVAITINDFGESYNTDMVEDSPYTSEDPTDPFATLRRTYIQTGIRRMLRHFGKRESDEIVCATLPSFNVQVNEDKRNWNWAVGAIDTTMEILTLGAYDSGETVARCGSLYKIQQSELDKYINSTSYIADIQEETKFDAYTVNQTLLSANSKITNPQALEIYARADEHWFTGPHGLFIVKVSVPAYIFDMVPPAPKTPEPDAAAEEVVFNAQEFVTNIIQLEAATQIHAKYQAYFYEFENGRLYMSAPKPSGSPTPEEPPTANEPFESAEDSATADPGFFEQSPDATLEPFYLTFYKGRFDKFLRSLKKLIEIEPEGVENFKFNNARASQSWSKPEEENQPEVEQEMDGPQDDEEEYEPTWGGGFYSTGIGDEMESFFTLSRRVDEIKITFDKEDDLNPYKIKSVHARLKNCSWEKVVQGFDKFKQKWSEDQTLMGYIANIDSISKELQAKVSPNWLDFTIKYTYPPLSINYGSHDRFTDRTAFNCIMEDFSKLDDWILSESISFMDAFAYRLNQNNCKILNATGSSPPTLRWDGDNWIGMEEYADKTWAAAKQRAYGDDSTTVAAIKKYAKQAKEDWEDESFSSMIKRFNPCNWTKITTSAMRCLMNGLELDIAYKTIIKQTILSGGNELLEIFIKALPADKQEQIRKLVESEFGSMPWPWEDGWDPGDNSATLNKYTTDRLNDRIQAEQDFRNIFDKFTIEGIILQRDIIFNSLSQQLEILGFDSLGVLSQNLSGWWDGYRAAIDSQYDELSTKLEAIGKKIQSDFAPATAQLILPEIVQLRLWSAAGGADVGTDPNTRPKHRMAFWNPWVHANWSFLGGSDLSLPESNYFMDINNVSVSNFPFDTLTAKVNGVKKEFKERAKLWKAQKQTIVSRFISFLPPSRPEYTEIKSAVESYIDNIGKLMDDTYKQFDEETNKNTSLSLKEPTIEIQTNLSDNKGKNPVYVAISKIYKALKQQLVEKYQQITVDQSGVAIGIDKPANTIQGVVTKTTEQSIAAGSAGLKLEKDTAGRLTNDEFKKRYNMSIVDYINKKVPNEIPLDAYNQLGNVSPSSEMEEFESFYDDRLTQGEKNNPQILAIQGKNWIREFHEAMLPLVGKSLEENTAAAEQIKKQEEEKAKESIRSKTEDLFREEVESGSFTSLQEGQTVKLFTAPTAAEDTPFMNLDDINNPALEGVALREVTGWTYRKLKSTDNYRSFAQQIVGKQTELIPIVSEKLQVCNATLFSRWGHDGRVGISSFRVHTGPGGLGGIDVKEGKATGAFIAVPSDLTNFYKGVFHITDDLLPDAPKEIQKYIDNLTIEQEEEKQELGLEFDKKVKAGQVPGIQWEQWERLTPEEREEFIQRLNSKTFFIKGSNDPNAQYKVGTFGKALGNVQKAVFNAYIEAIFEVASMQEAMSAFDRLPGVDIFKLWFSTMECPKRHWIEPPIDSFLESYSFDMCGEGTNPLKPEQSLVFPWDTAFPEFFSWNWFKAMSDAFLYSLRQLTNNFLKTLLIKMAEIVDAALCKGLATLGEGFQSWIAQDGRSWADIVDDVFCGDDAFDPEAKKKLSDDIIKASIPANNSSGSGTTGQISSTPNPGPAVTEPNPTEPAGGDIGTNGNEADDFVDNNPLPPVDNSGADGTPDETVPRKTMSFGSGPKDTNETNPYRKVANALSYVATSDEIKRAMTSTAEDQDYTFLANMSRVLTAAVPELAGSYNTPEKVMTFFMAAGNLMSMEQRNQVRNSLVDEIDDFPLETSICLTKPQKDLWDETRKQIFENAGLSPQSAADFVKAQDDKVVSDLEDMVDFYNAGIEGKFGDALNQALGQGPLKDPDCKDVSVNIVPNPKQAEAANKLVTTGMFARLEKSFIDDLVESNNLLSGIDQMVDGLFDTPGILNVILSDKAGYLLSTHNFIDNFAILSLWGLIDVTPDLPETVALHLRDEMFRVGKNSYNPTINSKSDWNFEMDWKDKSGFNWWIDIDWTGIKSVYPNVKFRDISTIESNNFYGYDLKVPEYDAFSIDKKIETDMIQIIEKYQPPNEEVIFDIDALGATVPHRPHVLNNFIIDIWSKASMGLDDSEPLLTRVRADKKMARSIVFGMNRMLFDDFMKELLTSDSPDGLPQGFKYGAELTELTPDDFVYVDPEPGAQQYTYQEEDKVLGKSKTDNPRVKFLDPSIHGGSYEKPFLYVSPPKHDGWMNMSQVFISNVDGCTDVAYNSLDLPSVLEKINKAKSQAKDHQALEQSPDCVIELPFDKIAEAETLAQLEGIIVATIRIYLTEYLITTLPIYSNIRLKSNNYGDGILEYISKKMKNGLNSQTSWFATTYEGHTYFLLFLEQVAQTVKRKVDAGEIELTPDIEEAFNAINRAQEQHKHLNWWDIWSTNGDIDVQEFFDSMGETSDFDSIIDNKGTDITVAETIMLGSLYVAFGASAKAVAATLLLGGPVFFSASLFSLERARFASKIFTIKKVEKQCMSLLKILIKQELKVYEDRIEDTLPERPYIYDVKKFLIGASKIALGETTSSGTYDTELPVGGSSDETNITPSFGTVNHCATKDMNHPLNEVKLKDGKTTLAKLKLDGGFYLEKYLRIQDKTSVVMDVDEGDSETIIDSSVPDWVANRAPHLKNVVNILEFRDYLSNNVDNFTVDTNISDLFGNARLTDDAGSEYEASIGIKFGVRICLIPPKIPQWVNAPQNEPQSNLEPLDPTYIESLQEHFKKEKSFFFSSAPTFEGEKLIQAKYSFPIASYEQDIGDLKVHTLVNADDDLNQNLKCYVDRLTETQEFRYFFDYILNVEKIPSIMSVYSDVHFVSSLGEAEGERNDPANDDSLPAENLSEYLFNDSKEEARSLFVANYKRNDFDPPEENEEQGFFANRTKALLSNLWANISGGLPWWVKSRIRDSRPVDEEGNQCGNFFASQFQIKEKK